MQDSRPQFAIRIRLRRGWYLSFDPLLQAVSRRFEELEERRKHYGRRRGVIRRKVYLLPQLHLQVGTQVATLHYVPAFPTPVGADRDELYGNLGQDFVSGFESFTLDFSKMTFSLGAALAVPAKQ